jgi:diamine N-acetyltransferase
MSTIALEPVTEQNWLALLDLAVQPEQQDFVPSVTLSLAKAYIQPNGFCYDPFAVYRRQRTGKQLIGFFSLIHLPEQPTFCYLGGFLIDQRFQGQGYGRAALAAIIRFIGAEHPHCATLFLSVHPQNQVAERLYLRTGFTKTGKWLDGEAEMQLQIIK